MSRMFVIAGAVVADAIRRKVIWVVLVFAALLALVIPSLPSYGVGIVGAVFREVVIALMFSAALVVALALAATRIPAEIDRRTVFNILVRDVSRWHYVVGTWLGMFVVVGAVLAAFSGVALAVGLVVYKVLMFKLLEATLAVWLEMGVLMAFTVMLSARFGIITSVVGALAFAFVGHSVGSLVAGPEATAPWYVPSLSVFDVINPVAHGSGYSIAYAGVMLLAFAAWSGLLLAAGSAMFGSRDL